MTVEHWKTVTEKDNDMEEPFTLEETTTIRGDAMLKLMFADPLGKNWENAGTRLSKVYVRKGIRISRVYPKNRPEHTQEVYVDIMPEVMV